MPEVISTTERTELAPHVREGYLMLYIYLPSTFKDDFIPFVGPVIPSVLKVTLLFTPNIKKHNSPYSFTYRLYKPLRENVVCNLDIFLI